MTMRGTMKRDYEDPQPKSRDAKKRGSVDDGRSMTMDAQHKVSPLSIEWWYFDVILNDGTSIVVMFGTKRHADPRGSLAPEVRIAIRLPGTTLSLEQTMPVRVVKSHIETSAGVPISFGSKNQVSKSIKDKKAVFEVRASAGNLSVDMTLTSETPAVQIGSGDLAFNLGSRENRFGWRVPVPYGTASVTYKIDDQEFKSEGVGYHDHNWADCLLFALAHDWYWGHAHIGCYTVVASVVAAQDMFGGKSLPELILIENDRIITPLDKSANVVFSKEQPVNDSLLGAPFAGVLRFEYSDKKTETKYVVTFRRDETIYVETIKPASSYRRFLGSCTLEISHSDEAKTRAVSEFLWLGEPPAFAPPPPQAKVQAV